MKIKGSFSSPHPNLLPKGEKEKYIHTIIKQKLMMISIISQWLTPPRFEPEMEAQYQSELSNRLFKQVYWSILLGIITFLIFIVLDFIDMKQAPALWILRISFSVLAFGLWLYLFRRPQQAMRQLFGISITMAVLAIISLLALSITLMAARSELLEVIPSKMLIIAYIFGPIATPIAPAVLLCLAATMIMLAIGVYFHTPYVLLFESVLHLLTMIFFGWLSSYQIEEFSRNSFRDRKLAERGRDLAEKVAAEKARFLRNASHNLRQPVQAVTSFSWALTKMLQRYEIKNREVIETANDLHYSTNLLREDLDKVLSASMISDGYFKTDISTVNLSDVFDNIHSRFSSWARDKNILLKVEANELCASSDNSVLHQIFGNLVENAIKYTDHGWVVMRAIQVKDAIRVHVVDSGHGIAEENQPDIFKPFRRANSKLDVSGFGLGLSYVQDAISILPGHRLSLRSKEGMGTHFCVTIPLSNEILHANCEHKNEFVDETKNEGLILLVDDEGRVLHALEIALSAQGYTIVKASCVAEIRPALREYIEAPSLVITDYKLQDDETAEDVIRCAQNLYGDIPTIILSGEIDTEKQISSRYQDCVFLTKPVDTPFLLQTINGLMR